jgi:O-antigen ligase
MITSRNITIVGLVQVLLAVYSVLFVSAFLKLNTIDGQTGPAIAVWIRAYGFIFILIPFFWTSITAYSASRSDQSKATYTLAALGICILIIGGVLAFLATTATFPMQPGIIMGKDEKA